MNGGLQEPVGRVKNGGLANGPFPLTPSCVKSTTEGRPTLSLGEREFQRSARFMVPAHGRSGWRLSMRCRTNMAILRSFSIFEDEDEDEDEHEDEDEQDENEDDKNKGPATAIRFLGAPFIFCP